MDRERKTIEHGNMSTKNTARLYLYHEMLMAQPKIIDINQKNGFKHQNKTLLKRNTKDITLSGEWMK